MEQKKKKMRLIKPRHVIYLLTLAGAATAGDKLNINDRFLNPYVLYRGAQPADYSAQMPFEIQKTYETDANGSIVTRFGGLLVTDEGTLGDASHNIKALERHFDEKYLAVARQKYHKIAGKAKKAARGVLTEIRQGIDNLIQDEGQNEGAKKSQH